MVLAFSDSTGLVYSQILLWSATINANYTMLVLDEFLMHLKNKMAEMREVKWFFH
jgi:ATP:corrinoid adenosyltransferase